MHNSRRCCIFGAGEMYTDRVDIPPHTFVIAADGGLNHLLRLAIKPDICLGDFDSSDIDKALDERVVYPVEKDYTDMHLAVEYGIEKGCTVFDIYGGLGGERIDHSIANLQMLSHFAQKGCTLFLHGKNQLLTAVSTKAHSAPITVTFDKSCDGYLSLFATDGYVDGLTLKGLQYPLDNARLTDTFPLCVSNRFIGETAHVRFTDGTLLFVFSDGIPLPLITKEETL